MENLFHENLCEKFVLRLASLSSAMGLDDEDEALLWEYVALAHMDGEDIAEQVASVLLEQAVLNPILVTRCSYRATIDNKFLKPTTFLGLSFTKKKHVDEVFPTLPGIFESRTAFEKEYRMRAQEHCIALWWNDLTAILRPNGVDWEPPCMSDVIVDMDIQFITLKSLLSIED